MKRAVLAPLFAMLALFYLSGDIIAIEDSVFEDLSSEEKNLRTVFGTENQNLESYLDVKQSYINLAELHNRSFGTRKEELALQLVARAQDVLVSKTGAVLNYTQHILAEAEKIGRLSDDELKIMTASATEFREIASGYEEEVSAKTTSEELTTLAVVFNSSFSGALTPLRSAIVQLSIARGEFLVEQMQAEGELIQAHINAAANAGGDVAPIQEAFNEGMLNLEEAKTRYQKTTASLSGIDFNEGKMDPGEFLYEIVSTNKRVSSGHGSLKNVLSSLEALYSQSPWQLEQDGE